MTEEKREDSVTTTMSGATEMDTSASASQDMREADKAEKSGDKAAAVDETLKGQNRLADKIRTAQSDMDQLAAAAAARGEDPPSIPDKEALSQQAGSMNAQDIAMAEQRVDQTSQSINGEQGKQMLQTVVGGAAALAALGGAAGMAAALAAVSNSEGLVAGAQASNMQNASFLNKFDPGQGGSMFTQEKLQERQERESAFGIPT